MCVVVIDRVPLKAIPDSIFRTATLLIDRCNVPSQNSIELRLHRTIIHNPDATGEFAHDLSFPAERCRTLISQLFISSIGRIAEAPLPLHASIEVHIDTPQATTAPLRRTPPVIHLPHIHFGERLTNAPAQPLRPSKHLISASSSLAHRTSSTHRSRKRSTSPTSSAQVL